MTLNKPEGIFDIGIDAGSKTIKVVVLDEDGNLIHDSYRRHGTNIQKTLQETIHDVVWRRGDLNARIAVTGSAGIEVAKLLDVPFVQEVIALTDAVKDKIPDADAVIELGGEDSKIVYLTGGLEQRMNSTCAGGTGGFIDSISYMLGVRASQMERLAMGALKTYPIASRCAVFAQTDVRPLLNAGASKADIAASVHEAVVRQTLGGLACGRPIRGKVVFLGGPFQFNCDLLFRFRNALGLDASSGIRPENAHLFPAYGAALTAAKEAKTISLSTVEDKIKTTDLQDAADQMSTLEPLFTDTNEIGKFVSDHDFQAFPKKTLFESRGALYLGIDAGSTTSKIALIDSDGNLIYSDYQENKGDTIDTVKEMLMGMYMTFPKHMRKEENNAPYIAASCATGYGEGLLQAGFGVDSGVVETMAHATAAQIALPGVTFMLDIGGQDMKALWIEDGQVVDAVLNEACSSGCGAFVSGTAYAVRSSKEDFARKALESKNPVDLGTKCTVFMSSKVKHAQKAGTPVEDIAAGVAYSVIQNALFRIIGSKRARNLGDKILVGGGTFKSNAILRAFELISGQTAVRPREAHLMGAIGAAFIAKKRAESQGLPHPGNLITLNELKDLKITRKTAECTGCQNACALSILSFGNGRRYIGGNKCEHGRLVSEAILDAPNKQTEKDTPINTIQREQIRIAAFGDIDAENKTKDVATIGLLASLDQYENLPFWHTLISECGFNVRVPEPNCEHLLGHTAWESVPAESICYPAKITHARAFSLRDKNVTHIFATSFDRGIHCPVSSGYSGVLNDSIDFIRNGDVKLIAPELSSYEPERIVSNAEDRQSLFKAFSEISKANNALDFQKFEEAIDVAYSAYTEFLNDSAQDAIEALDWIGTKPCRRGIVIAARPYHSDPALMNGIDEMLAGYGFAVLGLLGLKKQIARSWESVKGLVPFETVWKPGKRDVRAAEFVATHPDLDLLCLQSFGCGYDAVAINQAEVVIKDAGKPFTTLKLDEMVDLSHIRIRLRTLAEMIFDDSQAEPANDESDHIASVDNRSESKVELDPKQKDGDNLTIYPLSTPMDTESIERARKLSTSDVCFAARAIAAKTLCELDKHPNAKVVKLPYICEQCLVDAVPTLVELTDGKTPNFEFTQYPTESDFFAIKSSQKLSKLEQDEVSSIDNPDNKPLIGILGNSLLCFDPLMNENLANIIESLGCKAVFPNINSLFCDTVEYTDELARFEKLGVHHVIYLQSFSCLKANSQMRGHIHSLKDRFPNITISVLDYDPESSELNRENRIRLALEAAKTAQDVTD